MKLGVHQGQVAQHPKTVGVRSVGATQLRSRARRLNRGDIDDVCRARWAPLAGPIGRDAKARASAGICPALPKSSAVVRYVPYRISDCWLTAQRLDMSVTVDRLAISSSRQRGSLEIGVSA